MSSTSSTWRGWHDLPSQLQWQQQVSEKREKVAPFLCQYFERRLLDATRSDHQRSFPVGYFAEFHRASGCHVLRHEATKIVVGSHCVDLIERVDRSKRTQKAAFVFVYPSSEAVFTKAAALAHREPKKSWRSLVESGMLTALEEEAGGTWYSGFSTLLEPPEASDMASALAPAWCSPSSCLVFHIPAHRIREPAAGWQGGPGGPVVELWFGGGPPREAGQGVWVWPAEEAVRPEELKGLRLVEAAGRRDGAEVAALLEARADANYQDARGWSALHAACAAKPCWEVLNRLFEVCDPCLRTNHGQLACDLSDAGAHEEASKLLKELMQKHDKAKYLPAATSALSPSKKAALGITELDWTAAARTGHRQDGDAALETLHEFSQLVIAKYGNSDVAFKAFDINGNGTLSRAEFTQYAPQTGFTGDVTSLFKALDVDRQGDVCRVEFSLLQTMYDAWKKKKQEEEN